MIFDSGRNHMLTYSFYTMVRLIIALQFERPARKKKRGPFLATRLRPRHALTSRSGRKRSGRIAGSRRRHHALAELLSVRHWSQIVVAEPALSCPTQMIADEGRVHVLGEPAQPVDK